MKGRTNHEPTLTQVREPLGPAVYAASLSDYVAGEPHGAWIDADQTADAIGADISQMLEASQQPQAEEWAIHDYQGFGSFALSEYEQIEVISALGQGIVEHGLAFADWAQIVGTTDLHRLSRSFEDHYLGHYPSLVAYARNLLDDMGIDRDALAAEHHSWLNRYLNLDVEAFAQDLAHDLDIADADDGGVHIFQGQ